MKILFLTRVHPPVTGGLENQSYNLINNFKKINKETFSIINTKGKKALPYFLPYAYAKALRLIKKHKITHVHLSDGVMALIGARLKKKTGVKVAVTIHGLDVTFDNKYYQKIIPKRINELDKVICISENTKKECLKKGIDKNKIVVVPNGVNSNEFVIRKPKAELREKLSKEININLKGKKILFTSGRLVKRKGVEWFVSNVMPKLGKDYIYLISGDGGEREMIEKAINQKNLKNVYLLGKTDFEVLKLLYNSADLFIMPNISVRGDVEGFGLVAVEAGSCGLPVIASKVDGIPAAVLEGKTGWLVKEKDVEGFVRKIKLGVGGSGDSGLGGGSRGGGKLSRKKVRNEVKNHFDWGRIVGEYKEVMMG